MARPREGGVGLAGLPTVILGFGGFALLGGDLGEEFVSFPNLSGGGVEGLFEREGFFGEWLSFGEVALGLQKNSEIAERSSYSMFKFFEFGA